VKETHWWTRALAIGGTGLVWFVLLAPAMAGVIALGAEGTFRFDYLLPAELFPAAGAGGILLLWAALRARSQRSLIGLSLAAAAGLLAGGQALAESTGLATGEIGPSGWPWALVLGTIAAYALALAVIGAGGLLLLRDLYFGSTQAPAA